MKLKISKLTCTFIFTFISLFFVSQSIYAMEDFERQAEKSAEGLDAEETVNARRIHNHKHLWNANFFFGGSGEAQLDKLTLRELMYIGAQRGVVQGTSQVVASLIVELTQLSILKGAEFFLAPSKEEQQKILQAQQLKTEMGEQEKSLKLLQDTLSKNGPMISTLVDGAAQLNEEQAKKMAIMALMKYGNQVNVLLDIQNQLLGMPTEKAIPTR